MEVGGAGVLLRRPTPVGSVLPQAAAGLGHSRRNQCDYFQHDTDDDDDDDEGEEKGGDGNGAEHNKKRRQAPLPTTLKLAIMILVLAAMAGLWFDSYAAYEGLQVARNWLGSMSYLCHSVTALICFRLFDVSGSVTQRLAKVGWVRG